MIEEALQANGIHYDVKVHADAGDFFLNDHDPNEASAIFKVLAKISGAEFHLHPSALDVRRPIIGFFDKHLK